MFLMNHVEPLLRRGIRMNFAVDTAEPQHFDAYVKSLGCRIFPVTPYSKSRPGFMRDIRRILRENPEIKAIHAHMNYANIFILAAAAGTGAKRISHAHSSFKSTGLINSMIKSGIRALFPLVADGLWGCSQAANEWLYGRRRARGAKALFVPNAINTARWRFDAAKGEAMRKKLGFDDNNFVLIHTGSFTPVKNHKFLLELFAEYKSREPEARLILCGDGPLRPQIEAQIAELGIADAVTLTGNIDNAEEYLSAADMFILPSLFEGFSISLIEAQCNGLTTTTTTTAVPPNAKLRMCQSLPDYDMERWIETIDRRRGIANNREEGVAAVEAAGFSVEANADMLAKAYEKILEG